MSEALTAETAEKRGEEPNWVFRDLRALRGFAFERRYSWLVVCGFAFGDVFL